MRPRGSGPGRHGVEWTGTELPGSRVADRSIGHAVIGLDATLVEAHSDKQP